MAICKLNKHMFSKYSGTTAYAAKVLSNPFYFIVIRKTKNKENNKIEYQVDGYSFLCRDSLISRMMKSNEMIDKKEDLMLGLLCNPSFNSQVTNKTKESADKAIEKRFTETIRVLNLIEDKMGWKKTIRKKVELSTLTERKLTTIEQKNMDKIRVCVLRPSPEWLFSSTTVSLYALLLRNAGRYIFEKCTTYEKFEDKFIDCAESVPMDVGNFKEPELMLTLIKNVRQLYPVKLRGLAFTNSAYSGIKAFTTRIRKYIYTLDKLRLKKEYIARPYVIKNQGILTLKYSLEADPYNNRQSINVIKKVTSLITEKNEIE